MEVVFRFLIILIFYWEDEIGVKGGDEEGKSKFGVFAELSKNIFRLLTFYTY